MERKVHEKKLNETWKNSDLAGLYQTLCFSTADLVTGHQNVLLNTMAAHTIKNMDTDKAKDWARCMYHAQALADQYAEFYEMVTLMAHNHLSQEEYETIDEGLKCGPKKLPPVNQNLMLDLYRFELPALFVDKGDTRGAHFCTATTQTDSREQEKTQEAPLKAKELSQSVRSYTEKQTGHMRTPSAHDMAKSRKKSGKKAVQKTSVQKSPSKDKMDSLKEVHPQGKNGSLSMFSVLPSIAANSDTNLGGDNQQSTETPRAAKKAAKKTKLKPVHVGSKSGTAGLNVSTYEAAPFEHVEKSKPGTLFNFPKLKPISRRSKADPWKPIYDK